MVIALYFCITNILLIIMEYQAMMWISLMVLLGVIFSMYEIIKCRKEAGKTRLFEISDDYVSYEWPED